MKHRILVTGLTGFVGRCLETEFSERRDVELVELASPNGVRCDLRDRDAVFEAVARIEPTAVIHLAAIAAPAEARGDPFKAWSVNVMGTLNLGQACLRHASDAKFVFVGSSEAYGQTFNDVELPVTEQAPLQPLTTYGTTKAAADLLVAQLSRDGLNAIRFRPFNHTGPGQPAEFVIPSFARQIARIEHGLQPPCLEVGSLDARRDFLDARDVVRAYAIAVLGSEWEAGTVLNLATGDPRKIGDVLNGLIALSHTKIDWRVDPARLRPNEVPISSGSAQSAYDTLRWRPTYKLEQTLEDVLNYWRDQVSRNGIDS